MPSAPRTVVVLAAHGSRAASGNDAHRALAASLSAALDLPVLPAFLELAEPSIGDTIDAAAATGAGTVLVLPYFLHPGRHLNTDVPAIVTEAQGRHPSLRLELLASFGADERVVKLLAHQVGAALPPP